MSTDKVDTEIPSPVAGTLVSITAEEDDTVAVGGELAKIGDAGAAAEAEARAKPEPEPEPEAEEEPEPEPKPEEAEPEPEPKPRSRKPKAEKPEAQARTQARAEIGARRGGAVRRRLTLCDPAGAETGRGERH